MLKNKRIVLGGRIMDIETNKNEILAAATMLLFTFQNKIYTSIYNSDHNKHIFDKSIKPYITEDAYQKFYDKHKEQEKLLSDDSQLFKVIAKEMIPSEPSSYPLTVDYAKKNNPEFLLDVITLELQFYLVVAVRLMLERNFEKIGESFPSNFIRLFHVSAGWSQSGVEKLWSHFLKRHDEYIAYLEEEKENIGVFAGKNIINTDDASLALNLATHFYEIIMFFDENGEEENQYSYTMKNEIIVEPQGKENSKNDAHKNCPYCDEKIKVKAIKCKHCKSLLEEKTDSKEVIFTDGTKYVGDFKDKMKHGKGTLVFPNGDKYVGDFKNDMANGKGTFTTSDGSKYVGEYKDNMKHGNGTLIWPNGDKYVGDFKNDMRHGQGTYTTPDGGKVVGEFKRNKLDGHAKFIWPDGAIYVGEFKDHQQHGWGTLTVPKDGTKYEGEWKNNVPHGQGKFFLPDGNVLTGTFENGDYKG